MSEMRERLDRELAAVVPQADARAAIARRVEQRKRRRRLVLVPATLLLTATILAGLTYAFRTKPSPPGRDVGSPVDGEVAAQACEEGPWIKHCPEAEWARSVAMTAGLDIVDERAVLIVGPSDGGEFMFWAMDPALHSQVEPLAVEIADSTMVRAGAVDGIPIYSSRHGEEFVWSVHGLNVWVAEEIIGSPPPRNVIAALVRASSSLPYESGEPLGDICDFPSVLPTYLPWLAPGESIPEPEMDRWPVSGGEGQQDPEPGYSILSWSNGDVTRPGPDPDVGTVRLSRSTLSVGSFPVDPEVPSMPDGSTGRLFGTVGEPGDWSIVWGDPTPDMTDDDCSETSLVVSFPNFTRSETRQEIMRIAESLVSA